MAGSNSTECLRLDGIDALRKGRVVLSDVSFTVCNKEIVSIIGPNGAGKSTLFDVITGFLKPSAGRMYFQGRDITTLTPDRRCHLGIARTFQVARPFSGMTAVENVIAALIFGKPSTKVNKFGDPWVRDRAMEHLKMVGIHHKANTPACLLTLSEQRRLEVARALATDPSLLLLDEFAAGLSPQAIDEALALIESLRSRGLTLLIIDHFLNVTVRVSDRLVAVDKGRVIAEGAVKKVLEHPAVVSAYLGI